MKKRIIWIIGANATGKSTLSAMVQWYLKGGQDFTANFVPLKSQPKFTAYTESSPGVCNIGKFNHPLLMDEGVHSNACCGTDSLPLKELITEAIQQASVEGMNTIFIEGIMATRQWLKLLPEEYEVDLVLLDIDLVDCFSRLMDRRAIKTGKSFTELIEEINEKTIKNISGKISGFARMYEDLSAENRVNGIRHKINLRDENDFDDLILKLI